MRLSDLCLGLVSCREVQPINWGEKEPHKRNKQSVSQIFGHYVVYQTTPSLQEREFQLGFVELHQVFVTLIIPSKLRQYLSQYSLQSCFEYSGLMSTHNVTR